MKLQLRLEVVDQSNWVSINVVRTFSPFSHEAQTRISELQRLLVETQRHNSDRATRFSRDDNLPAIHHVQPGALCSLGHDSGPAASGVIGTRYGAATRINDTV